MVSQNDDAAISERQILTDGLCQSDDHILAGCLLGQAAHHPHHSVHPHFELHLGLGRAG